MPSFPIHPQVEFNSPPLHCGLDVVIKKKKKEYGKEKVKEFKEKKSGKSHPKQVPNVNITNSK